MGSVRLRFESLVDYFRETLMHLPDRRRGKNSYYRIEDVGLVQHSFDSVFL